MLKIDSNEKTAALMESIHGSNCSEATRPQNVDRNNLEHAFHGQHGRGRLEGVACGARERRWARVLGAVRMLVSRVPLSWDQLTLGAACARVFARIPAGPFRLL